MPFDVPNLRSFFRGMGVPVAFGGVLTYSDTGEPVKGMVDTPVSIGLMQGGVAGVEMPQAELRIPFNAFSPMPADGDTVTVDGTQYEVGAPTQEDDGGIVCYPLLDM